MQLYQGYCLELMQEIPDKSVDMVLCDLPYGMTACKWDVALSLDKLWNEYHRITKDNGAICLFGSEPFSSQLRMSNVQHFKYDWIWVKNRVTGFLHAKNAPLKAHEIISVFSLGAAVHVSQSSRRMNYFSTGA